MSQIMNRANEGGQHRTRSSDNHKSGTEPLPTFQPILFSRCLTNESEEEDKERLLRSPNLLMLQDPAIISVRGHKESPQTPLDIPRPPK